MHKYYRLIETTDGRRIITDKLEAQIENIDVQLIALFTEAERENIVMERWHLKPLRQIIGELASK